MKKLKYVVRFQLGTSVITQIEFLLFETPCSDVIGYHRFRGHLS